MQPLELIDQMLSRKEFNCTRKQMEFLRELVVMHQDPFVFDKANAAYKKKQVANARRELTVARKAFEAALANVTLVENS
jgi:hypothetical protein